MISNLNKATQKSGAHLARGGTWLAAGSYSENIGIVILLIIAARALTVSDIGVISFLLMLIALSVTLASLALPYVAMHMIAKERGQHKTESANAVFHDVTFLSVILGVISLFVVVLTAEGIEVLLQMPVQAFVIRIAGLDVLPSVLIQTLAGSLLGAERFKEVGLAAIIGAIARTGLAIMFLLMGYGILGIIVAWLAGDILWCSILGIGASKEFPSVRRRAIRFSDFIDFAGPLYVSNIVEYLHQNIDRFILLILLGTEILGLYTPVVASVTMILIFSGSLVRPLISRISSISVSASSQTIVELTQKAIRWISFVFIPISFIFAIESGEFLLLVVGQDYLSAAPSLSILSVFIVLASQYYVFRAVLIGIGKSRDLLAANSIAVLANVCILFFLAGPLGLVGAAIARAFLFLFQWMISLVLIRRVRGLGISVFSSFDALIASIGMALGLILLKIIGGEFLNILFILIIGSLFYILALRVISPFSKDDFRFVRVYVPNRLEPIIDLFESFFLGNQKKHEPEILD